MTVAYVIALIFGGGLMALSLFSDVLEGADVDLDADLDVDGELDVDAGAGPGALRILSLRTVVYALFGFGAVGVILDGLWGGARPVQTAAFATVGAVATGLVASALFGLLKRSDSGERLAEDSFVGLTGSVLLPIGLERAGQVAVYRGDRKITLRALPHASAGAGEPEDWTDVLVVEMEAGVARVVPVDTTLELPPTS